MKALPKYERLDPNEWADRAQHAIQRAEYWALNAEELLPHGNADDIQASAQLASAWADIATAYEAGGVE